ncbi:endonuclease/exonuclease/phosphatase family protein [Nitriliruptor alkaliphilus]|uniref:endonuclease/exonuclease/phosphatase family protein n=1 Tax=Nitriliruptor alkaliphilus TaxID=427918 RepID=UPI00069734B4
MPPRTCTARPHPRRLLLSAVALAAALVAASGALSPAEAGPQRDVRPAGPQGEVRIATFNASLYRSEAGALVDELSDPGSAHPQVIAETIQRQRPDILLLNEFDHDAEGAAADLFHDNYLAIAQHAEVEAITYPYRAQFASNTGVPSGFDLNRDGVIGESGDAYGQDAFGYGWFPGQYAFAVFSTHPIVEDDVRTFQEFLWKDMPGALLPSDPATDEDGDWYSEEILDVFRLSSKNHVDVPVQVGRDMIHLLASHPTPPAFDGPERRNVLRNHDEIRFWADYISPGQRSAYIYDDEGATGGLRPGARFVILGDLNADPCDGDSVPGAIQQVLDHPLVQDPLQASAGAVEQTESQGGINLEHCNPPQHDTADFSPRVGNLRVDYALPRTGMQVTGGEVFWPTTDWEHFDRLIGTFPFPGTDHRMVHVDVRLPVGGPR